MSSSTLCALKVQILNQIYTADMISVLAHHKCILLVIKMADDKMQINAVIVSQSTNEVTL